MTSASMTPTEIARSLTEAEKNAHREMQRAREVFDRRARDQAHADFVRAALERMNEHDPQ